MSTARAKLHTDLVKMLGQKSKSDLAGQLDELLTAYRVQYKKPGDPSRQTARDALRDDLVAVASKPGKDLMAQIAAVLDEYRMQAKTSGPSEGKKAPRKKAAPAAASATPAAAAPAPRGAKAAPTPRAAAASARPAASGAPAAGAGSQRSTSRSECPKCHSMGVVLARSYATDEYYSCIYCGWQGFKPAEAMEAEDSLAARLLGIYSGAAIAGLVEDSDTDDES
ncbi:MAG: hypothetical protein ABIJ09_11920 [Pseudomonadota bacterium]